ncbi:MAG: alkaline phosphatase family protein [Bradymonadia bacterium]
MHQSLHNAERLDRWLDRGDILHPAAPGHLAFTDLMAVVLTAAGLPTPFRPEGTALAEAVGTPEHLVFVLVDGLGVPIIEDWAPEAGVLRRQMFQSCRAVFPSATASALTTVASGRWPGAHGITGWWTFLPDHDLTFEPLPWRLMNTREQATLSPNALFRVPSVFEQVPRSVCTVTPTGLADSIYSGWSAGDTDILGYENWDDAIDQLLARIRRASGPTLTWWYLPEFDRHGHMAGVSHKKTGRIVRRLDQALSHLESSLPRNTRVVLTADHGHINAHPEGDHILDADDPLLRHLAAPPSGEPVCPHFHLKDGQRKAFIDEFSSRFDGLFTLFDVEALVQRGVYGPDLDAVVRARLGDLVALSLEARTLRVRTGTRPPNVLKGLHGGLTPAEMLIPVVLF